MLFQIACQRVLEESRMRFQTRKSWRTASRPAHKGDYVQHEQPLNESVLNFKKKKRSKMASAVEHLPNLLNL